MCYDIHWGNHTRSLSLGYDETILNFNDSMTVEVKKTNIKRFFRQCMDTDGETNNLQWEPKSVGQ